MEKTFVKIYDGLTETDIVREANDLELAQIQIDRESANNLKIQLEEAEIAKAQAAIDKAALLERLGITEEEAKLLLN